MEAEFILDSHRHGYLPYAIHFFEISQKSIIFLFLILVSSSLSSFIGITSLGKTYALCLVLFYHIIKFFFQIYIMYGCNSTSSLSVGMKFKAVLTVLCTSIVAVAFYAVQNQPEIAGYSHKEALGIAHAKLEPFPASSYLEKLAVDEFKELTKTIHYLNPDFSRDPSTKGYSLNLDGILVVKQQIKDGFSLGRVEAGLYNSFVCRPANFNTIEGLKLSCAHILLNNQ